MNFKLTSTLDYILQADNFELEVITPHSGSLNHNWNSQVQKVPLLMLLAQISGLSCGWLVRIELT